MIHVEYQRKPYNFTEIYGKQRRLHEQWIPGRLSPPTRPGNEAKSWEARAATRGESWEARAAAGSYTLLRILAT